MSTTLVSRVEWWDTDASGHHHNRTIMRLVEAAEAKFARDFRLAGYFGNSVRVRHEVDFEARLYFDQLTTTTLTLDRLGRTSVTFGFEVWAEANEDQPRTRAAKGLLVAAHVPQGALKAQPWPADIVAALAKGSGDGPSDVGSRGVTAV